MTPQMKRVRPVMEGAVICLSSAAIYAAAAPDCSTRVYGRVIAPIRADEDSDKSQIRNKKNQVKLNVFLTWR